MRSGWPARLAAVVPVALVSALMAGCGISASGAPSDEGEGLQAGGLPRDAVQAPPGPDAAGNAQGLVQSFLAATAGGGEGAVAQVKKFLSTRALDRWRDPVNPENPQLAVIRVIGEPVTGAISNDRTPVTVSYQEVGLLNEQGRVDELTTLSTEEMTFWVSPIPDSRSDLRIDEIEGAPSNMMISDQALTEYYRIQPIYFWDQSNTKLVPDLRYLPLTISPDRRAHKLVQWLVEGEPSPWLAGLLGLPLGTAPPDGVLTNSDGRLVVKLNAEAGAGGANALRRLMLQLQASLRSDITPSIELRLDDQVQDIATSIDEFRRFNPTWAAGRQSKKYDIVDGRVVEVALGAEPGTPGVLASEANSDVVVAAVDRDAGLAGLVRRAADGERYLQFLRGDTVTDSDLGRHSDIGRPVWVPGAEVATVLVTAGGRVYAVDAGTGEADDVTPSRISGVTTVSVSPDGHRIALVAGGVAYVTYLSTDNGDVAVGSNLRAILAGQLNANSVAWTNETFLYLAGSARGEPAMWQVTADGVVAINVSQVLRQLVVTDVVAFPSETSRPGETLVTTQQGVYSFGTSLIEEALTKPFFAG